MTVRLFKLPSCARSRFPRLLLCVELVAGLAVLGTILAGFDEAQAEPEHVIPPGQEEMLGELLGRGATLPGDCHFSAGGVNASVVTAEYTCRDGSVVVELRHPDTAPPSALRTEQFALTAKSGSPPPGLLEALASLMRSHEAAFHWKQLPEAPGIRTNRMVGVAAAACGILIVALATQTLLRRQLPASGTWPRSATASAVATVMSALALCALAHAALRATGTLSSGLLWGRSGAELAAGAGALAALVPAAFAAATLTHWLASHRWLSACAAATVFLYCIAGFRASLLPPDLHYFGALSTLPPNMSSASATAASPGIVYRTNAFGFREPGFDAAKPSGVIRIALIGDSFVYGTGVGEDATLRARLAEELERRWPDQRFEVLNLGIPGNNLASHVELFAAATARLDLDAVVLCLTLANDLSRWDGQVERREARHYGLFSLARFLTGDAAPWLWASMHLETAITPAGLAHLDQQLLRLQEIRRRPYAPRALIFFGFQEWDPSVTARLQRIEGVEVVPDGILGPQDFIAGDGHPTALGNTRSAARLADTLAEDPDWLAILSSPLASASGHCVHTRAPCRCRAPPRV